MGKRYLSDGSANTAFSAGELSNSETNRLKEKIRTEVPAVIEAGQLSLLAEVSQTSSGRLERIADKMPNNDQILQKIAHALDVIKDPLRIQEWRQQNTAIALQANGGVA